jgi:hypothetical protein
MTIIPYNVISQWSFLLLIMELNGIRLLLLPLLYLLLLEFLFFIVLKLEGKKNHVKLSPSLPKINSLIRKFDLCMYFYYLITIYQLFIIILLFNFMWKYWLYNNIDIYFCSLKKRQKKKITKIKYIFHIFPNPNYNYNSLKRDNKLSISFQFIDKFLKNPTKFILLNN